MQQIKTLITSKEFGKTLKEVSDSEYRRLRENYDNFLDMPLELSMFIPIGDNGDILEEPIFNDTYPGNQNECEDYIEAKERCLFEGFKAVNHNTELCLESEVIDLYSDYWDNQNIEMIVETSLLNETPIVLTPTALKQIY